MKKHLLLPLALTALGPLAQAGIIEPHVLWDKTALKTCFFSDNSQLALTTLVDKATTKKNFDFSPKSLSKSKRENVKNVILNEFSSQRTGIHFTGFKDCKDEKNPDVIVMRAASKIILLDMPDFNGRAVIGQDGYFQYEFEENEQGERNYVIEADGSYHEGFFQKSGKAAFVALRTDNAGTITHEFGHVAGLRHEHIRAEAEQDKNCYNFGVVWPTKELVYDTAQFETNYDNRSIMNYCYLQSNKGSFSKMIGKILSDGDVQTLKAYY